MKTLALATAAVGLAFTATPAFADSVEYRTQDVSIAGLDLDTAEGQRILDQRVERAARSVCGYNGTRANNLASSYEARQCVAKAVASAKQQVAAIVEDQQRGG